MPRNLNKKKIKYMKLLQYIISFLVQFLVIIYKICAFLLKKFIGLDKLESSLQSLEERQNSQSTTASSSYTFSQVNLSTYSSSSSRESTPPKASNPVETDNTYRDIYVVKSLNKAKFQIYLIKSKVNHEHFAMKVFPFSGNLPHRYFKNEARFSFFDHNNVIKIHHTEKEREANTQGVVQRMSYIVMEYAPYGDMFEFVMRYTTKIDDRLIRTYFRQMIEGIEYLHENGVSHMDLKLENLLLGRDYHLKIADFDLSYLRGDSKIFGRGTKSYSAPEVIEGTCKNTQAADIYAAGVILFTMRTRGLLPYAEDKKIAGIDFTHLLHNDNQKFWSKHCELRGESESYFEEDFKQLFNAMVKFEAGERLSIKEIKQSNWYNGPYYSHEEVKHQVENILYTRNM